MKLSRPSLDRVHLGCGERYLEGYLNIDYPQSEHTVQRNRKIDLEMDLLLLQYPSDVLQEIRLEHVFEHFPRQVSCVLLSRWNCWLKADGILHIEVPDLWRSALDIVLGSVFNRNRFVAERHLFGSHEAKWACHWTGHDKRSLRLLLGLFGFEIVEFRRTSWQGTRNLIVLAKKVRTLDSKEALQATEAYLRHSMVDNSESELRLLESWMSEVRTLMASSD